MSTNTGETYLETAVRSAPPQKLHLMLVDGAIRFCRQAQQQRQVGNEEAAADALVRAQEIVTEMISVVDPGPSPEVAGKVAALYLYIFRLLVAAHAPRDAAKIEEAVALLEIERDTWSRLCARLGGQNSISPPHARPEDSPGSADFEA